MNNYTIKTVNRNTNIIVVSNINLDVKCHKTAVLMAKTNHLLVLQEDSNLYGLSVN